MHRNNCQELKCQNLSLKRVPSITEHVDLLNPFNLQHKCREVLLKGVEVVEHDIADSPFIPAQQCDTDVFLDPLDGNDKESFSSDIYILGLCSGE